MESNTIHIHVLKQGYSPSTIERTISSALDITFDDVDHRQTMVDDGEVTVAFDLAYTPAEYTTDTAVREAVENLIAGAPLHVQSTEMHYDNVTPQPNPQKELKS